MRGGLAGEENRGGLQLEKEILPPGIFINSYCITKDFPLHKENYLYMRGALEVYCLTSLEIGIFSYIISE